MAREGIHIFQTLKPIIVFIWFCTRQKGPLQRKQCAQPQGIIILVPPMSTHVLRHAFGIIQHLQY